MELTKVNLQSSEKLLRVDWDTLTASSNWIKLESSKTKVLIVTGWFSETRQKFNEMKTVLELQVVEEDGTACEKIFEVSSIRLLTLLRKALEHRDPASRVKLAITKIGSGLDTQYACNVLN